MEVRIWIALCGIILVSSEMLTVLQTSDDLSKINPNTGAELLDSSLYGLEKVTICARFVTHQFNLDLVALLSLPRLYPLWSFSGTLDIVGHAHGGEFTIWDLKVWNHICILLDSTADMLQTTMNGETVLKMEKYGSYGYTHSDIHNNLAVMGLKKEIGFASSSFGRMTDVNIWSHSLTEKETLAWTSCDVREGGDLLDWRTASWRAVGLQEVQVEREQICGKKPVIWVSTIKRNFDETVQLTNILRGEMVEFNSKNASEEIINILSESGAQGRCANIFFNGFTNMYSEGNFVSIYSGEKMTSINWGVGQPNNWGGTENCIANYKDKHHDVSCDIEICSFIRLVKPPKLQLRGVCAESDVDIFYTMPLYNETLFRKEILGLKQTKIIWSSGQKRWNIINLVNLNILAHTNSTSDYPFGTHNWFFTNSICTDPGQPWRQMNLQQKSKQPGRFCCRDGLCIDSKYRCDDSPNCGDYSDEMGCEMVQVPGGRYNPKNPPKAKTQDLEDLKVNTSIVLLNIIAIDEVASVISLMFYISFQWTDSRLTYNFLKDDIKHNTMRDVGERIWVPEVKFLVQSDQDRSIMVDHKITLQKLGNVSISGAMDSLHANETYTGKDNPLTLTSLYKGDFVCTFAGIYAYPFDQQHCQVQFYLSGKANFHTLLFPYHITNIGPNSVGQYDVRNWIVVPFTSNGGERGLEFSVDLERNLVSIFLVTFFPTLLMNLINQATNYIENNYEITLTINITCMMVLASVYISVSSSLPPTASIKSIEIWLLFNLTYPVMVILANIMLKVNTIIHYICKIIFSECPEEECQQQTGTHIGSECKPSGTDAGKQCYISQKECQIFDQNSGG